jgi:hemerythrin superfamily protein
MDAITLLKADHKKVEDLFKELLELSDTAHAARKKLFTEIDDELSVHAHIEEKIFYPALKAKTETNTDERDEVLEALEEHALVKGMLHELEVLDPKNEAYNAKLQVLSELVKHHVKEEEGTMFPQARELLSTEELKSLGVKLQAAKAKAIA